jgi:TonB-dependent SusC/RagA subfamily outer membrane receptor
MRYIQLKIVICFLIIVFSPTSLAAQEINNIDVTGTINSKEGKPVVGATIIYENDNISATSDFNGEYMITAPVNSSLSVIAEGYITKSVIITPNTKEIDVILEKDMAVQVAFRKVQERDLLGDVSFVNTAEILNKNYTINSLDGLQSLIGGFDGNIWGMSGYLVLVDGIPRDASSILAVEIDQISVLKGVSAIALYGSRAANGVISITSKRGVIQKQQISTRVNAGIDVVKGFPEYLGSAEYMSYYNQARVNDGLTPLHSEESIYNYASGKNPYRFL